MWVSAPVGNITVLSRQRICGGVVLTEKVAIQPRKRLYKLLIGSAGWMANWLWAGAKFICSILLRSQLSKSIQTLVTFCISHSWWTASELSYYDTSQIWRRFNQCIKYFCKNENSIYGEIHELCYSTPVPGSFDDPELVWHLSNIKTAVTSLK